MLNSNTSTKILTNLKETAKNLSITRSNWEFCFKIEIGNRKLLPNGELMFSRFSIFDFRCKTQESFESAKVSLLWNINTK